MTDIQHVHLTSEHPRAAAIVRAALEAYAAVNRNCATVAEKRGPHPGESEETRAHRARVLGERAQAADTMAAQITDAGINPKDA